MTHFGQVRSLMAVAAVASFALVPNVGCDSGNRRSSVSTSSTLHEAASCTSHAAVQAELDPGMSLVLPSVALNTGHEVRRGRSGPDSDPEQRYRFSKIALAVRSDQEAAIEVAGPNLGAVLIHWNGLDSPPVTRVVIPSCSLDGGAKWRIFAGGFWTREPTCVDLIVTVGQASRHVVIPVESGCPSSPPSAG